MINTEDYYERFAEEYFQATRYTDLSKLYDRFIKYLPPGGRILDAGCGSGRDTLAFLNRGYEVEAFDSSPSLSKLSSQLTGIKTRVIRFQDIDAFEKYDGIWACASLLHVPEAELLEVLNRLVRALKPGGAMYISFKLGMGERVATDGRFFTDMECTRLEKLISKISWIKLAEIWIYRGDGGLQGQNQWLNAIVQK